MPRLNTIAAIAIYVAILLPRATYQWPAMAHSLMTYFVIFAATPRFSTHALLDALPSWASILISVFHYIIMCYCLLGSSYFRLTAFHCQRLLRGATTARHFASALHSAVFMTFPPIWWWLSAELVGAPGFISVDGIFFHTPFIFKRRDARRALSPLFYSAASGLR